jgi:hypothetical protein
MLRQAAAATALLLMLHAPARAQSADEHDGVPPAPIAGEDASSPSGAAAVPAPVNDRIFGILPNYSTVERDRPSPALSKAQMFLLAGRGSFDPYVFPYLGVVAGLGPSGSGAYGRRYVTALADNALGNMMTSALLPAVLHQDPRYYVRGQGSVWSRAGYALSRSVVTRSSSGAPRFNASEIAGNLGAAAIANAYYPSANRSASATVTRWGSQVMWDTLANELKEFWPDLRTLIASRRHTS